MVRVGCVLPAVGDSVGCGGGVAADVASVCCGRCGSALQEKISLGCGNSCFDIGVWWVWWGVVEVGRRGDGGYGEWGVVWRLYLCCGSDDGG